MAVFAQGIIWSVSNVYEMSDFSLGCHVNCSSLNSVWLFFLLNPTESGKVTEDIITSDSVLGRIRGSLQDLIGKKDSDISQVNVGDFHATVERLAGGKEIIRIAQRDPNTDEPKSNQDIISSLQQILKETNGEVEVPGWLLKVYEKLNGNDGKKQTEWLLRDLNAQEDDLKPTVDDAYVTDKEAGSRDENGVKVTTEEVNQLLEDTLSRKQLDTDSKWLELLQNQILQSKLSEILVHLKFLLSKRPKDWQESYVNYLTKVKLIIERVEESVKWLDQGNDLESKSDGKVKDIKKFSKDTKQKLQLFKMVLSHLDNVAKSMLTKEEGFVKNDDIILVEELAASSESESSTSKDELWECYLES